MQGVVVVDTWRASHATPGRSRHLIVPQCWSDRPTPCRGTFFNMTCCEKPGVHLGAQQPFRIQVHITFDGDKKGMR
jgi:hypothetical protein